MESIWNHFIEFDCGSLSDQVGITSGPVWDHVGITLEPCWDHLGISLVNHFGRNHCGNNSSNFEIILGSLWNNVGIIWDQNITPVAEESLLVAQALIPVAQEWVGPLYSSHTRISTNLRN